MMNRQESPWEQRW